VKENVVRAVVGIIKRDDQVLVGERPLGKPYSGYWEFPGGKIEPNEQGKAALIRELHEELGIKVTVTDLWFSHTHPYPDKTVFLEMWLVKAFIGEPQPKENQLLRWVTFEELVALRLLEGNLPIIHQLKSLLFNQ